MSGANRDLTLLRAAVPAGAQRKGLNVQCTRHNTLPEVPRQIPCREDVAPLPAFPRPVRERHDAVNAAILERVDTALTHLERRQVAIRPIRRRIQREQVTPLAARRVDGESISAPRHDTNLYSLPTRIAT